MASFNLSECYSKLDQEELLRVISRMINIAFAGKRFLEVIPVEKNRTHDKLGNRTTPSRKALYRTDTTEA